MSKETIINTEQYNKFQYHQIIGGRDKYWDKRFCDTPSASEAREYLIKLRKQGKTIGILSKEMGISPSAISRVAGGTGVLISNPAYGGRSTTEYVVDKLREQLGEKKD